MLLLDTCAVIWLGNGQPLARRALDRIEDAGLDNGVFVSVISAWEIGLLASRPRTADSFVPNPVSWFANLMSGPGVRSAQFDSAIAIGASFLDWKHRDPADRLLVATARAMRVPIVTRDRTILDYAAAGHVEALAC